MPKSVPPIDDDIYEYVQSGAIPLEDDFNSALRKLLGLVDPHAPGGGSGPFAPAPQLSRRRSRPTSKRKRSRASRGSLLDDEHYELPILEALVELDGRAPTREVIDRVGEKLDGRLTDVDQEKLSSGDVRWRNRTQFVRLSLVRKGDMVQGSPRGLWEISDQGRGRVKGSES